MKERRGEERKYKSFEDEIYWSSFNKISFNATYHSDSQHKLQIPKKFADNVRLYKNMTLKGPSGVTFPVNLIRVGDGLFLHDGWQKFAKAYSLRENDILIFKYDRNSTFSVKIFTGECEKIGAYFVKECGQLSPAVENEKKRALNEIEESENSVRDDEASISTKKSRKNAEIAPVNHVGKVSCGTASNKILTYRKRIKLAVNLARKKAVSRMLEQQGRESHAEIKTEPEEHEPNNLYDDGVPHENNFEDIALPAKRAKTDHAEEHSRSSLNHVEEPHQSVFENVALPSIRAEIQPTKQYKQNRFNNNEIPHQSVFENVAMPAKRAETEATKRHKQNSFNNNEALQSGFENTVLPATRGEIELAKQPEKYVSIKRELAKHGVENVASPGTRVEYISNRRPVTDEERINAMRKVVPELTENSFFIALPISSCYEHFYLTVPASFAKAHLGHRKQDVSLCVGEKKWIAKFSFNRGRLRGGWKEFALHNNLEESDVCLFKLVNQRSGEPVMLDVTIFRVVDEVIPPTFSIVK